MTAIAIKPAHFPWFDYSRYSFSLGLKTPASVYLSGHTASEYDPVAKRIVIRGGMTAQVRTAWAKIGTILDASGLGFENVVRVVEYLRRRASSATWKPPRCAKRSSAHTSRSSTQCR